MMKRNTLSVLFAVVAATALAEQHREGWRPHEGAPMTFKADRVAVDNVTKAAVATGHVYAASSIATLRGEMLERDAEGKFIFHDPTCVTTCTNDVGHTHWNVRGEVEYKEKDYVILRNAWVSLYEIPFFYLPYLYYPLETDCGFSWMPGYMGSWGAYLLTRYRYDIAGDPYHQDNTWWLKGGTRADVRYRQGFAVGEDLDWNLGDFGQGCFKVYHGWDQDARDRASSLDPTKVNWGSTIEEKRYGMTLKHLWNVTERDTINIRGSFYSDSYFRMDFMRKTFFEKKSQWLSYQNSGVVWEHNESAWSFGAETSGRLNEFIGMTERLPEFYLDLNPTPVWTLPVNYESDNRFGWLDRRYAKYAAGPASVFGADPGIWCDYEALRLNTYHRLTAPFKTFSDVLSVVPRLAYRGTYWSRTGATDYYGKTAAQERDPMFRSIAEGGVTFAGRGTAWVSDTWSHMVEPYFDVLAQKAWYSGRDGDSRPYVFDNIDASLTWEDQFAGRGRNLPYSYYGVTPGLRNAWSVLDEKGHLRQVVDFDTYAAVSFGETSFGGNQAYGNYDMHKIAELGKPNYGKHGCAMAPGARVRWTPSDDILLFTRAEYDSDYNKLALADIGWSHGVTKDFKYDAAYCLRDARYWDFSSTPYSKASMSDDAMNSVKIHVARVGCEYQPLDWLAFGPYVRWDILDNELDSAGGWIDYLTDCLGFRLIIEYESAFMRMDKFEVEENWNVSFCIYLRAFGPSSGNLFLGR